MNLKEWAASAGVSYTTARRWFEAGKLPVPARKVGGLILVGEPEAATVPDDDLVRDLARALVALCARLHGSERAVALAVAAVRDASA